jgi:predicted amidophosphoribosyltransferase
MEFLKQLDLIWYVVIWVLSLVIGIKLRHGSGMLWALILGPAGVLVAVLLHAPPNTMKCPDCAERVKGEAKVCKHCGHKFEKKEESKLCPSCHERVVPVDGQCPNCEMHL